MAQNKQLNILAWYDDIQKQNHRKWWAFDRVFSLITELDTLPPFQMVRAQTGAQITELKLIDFQTSIETDILGNAQSTGLEVAVFTDYDLVIYPSVSPLQIANISAGHYYLKMSDGANTWFSEVFNMSDDLSDFIKIEYWHGEDFVFPNGHIRYQFPFKNRLYVPSDIGKPSYEYEEQVVKRDGYNFPTQQISFKLHRFVMLAPEFLIDAMRVIRMHDFVEIFYQGYEHNVDELLMNDPKWQTQGDVAEVEIEFKTDTVVVVNGRGLTSTVYELLDGNCIQKQYSSVAKITEGSAEFSGFYYLNAQSQQIQFENGDKVLIERTGSGNIELATYNSSAYSYDTVSNDEIVWSANEDEYWFFETDTFIKPKVMSYESDFGQGLIRGRTFIGSLVEVYSRDSSNVETKVGEGLSSDFMGTGVAFTFRQDAVQFKIKCSSFVCPEFEESAWVDISGIGFMTVENTFIIA